MEKQPHNKALLYLRLSALLLVVGIVVRIASAWWYRHAYNPDYGIVVLMVRHILEGGPWPVFFYGQAYMGSVEPLVSALFAALMGPRGFPICLGTAAFGIGLLFVVRAWARDIGGREAGFAALLFSVIGPAGYVHYLASPRGGYGAAMLFGALVLWWGARMLAREVDSRPPRASSYLLLGLVAGIGFWSNYLVAPALATVGLAFLLWLRWRVLRPRVLVTIPGFLIGSAPVWLWNMRHHWASFAMTESMGSGRPPLSEALRLLVTSRLVALMDVQGTPWIVQGLALLLLVGLIALAFPAFRHVAPQRTRAQSRITLSMALLYLPLFLLAFCSSQYALTHTSRYLLPLVPVLAVLIGVGTARLNALTPHRLGWLPLALLTLWQVARLPLHTRRAELDPFISATSPQLADDLEAHDIHDVYADYFHFSLNYLTDERICFSDPVIERYLPYRRRLELNPRIAILENLGGVEEYLAATGGNATFERHVRGRLHYDFEPPEGELGEIPPGVWDSVHGTSGEPLGRRLCDRRLDTVLDAGLPLRHPESVTILLKEPQTLAAVRIYSREGPFPLRWRIDVQPPGSDAFEPVSEPIPVSNLFWSGPRLYWGGHHYRMACRFEPRQAQAVRIWFDKDDRSQTFSLGELQLLTPTTVPSGHLDADSLKLLLQSRGIRRLYGDRWVVNRVHTTTGGAIWTQREPTAFPQETLAGPVVFSPGMGIACPPSGLTALHDCLAQCGIVMRETPIGHLGVLFDFGPGQWRDLYADIPGMRFHGAYATVGQHKLWADRIYRSVIDQPPVNPALLERALSIYPDHTPAREALAAELERRGEGIAAERLRATARAQRTPQSLSPVTFANGVQFEGLSLANARAAAGTSVPITYYWRCPETTAADQLAVFVHLEQGDTRLQDDHVLLAGHDTASQPFDEVFREERTITIPEDTPPGVYPIRLGLYHRAPPSRRVRLKTRESHRFRAVTLPVALTVTEAQQP